LDAILKTAIDGIITINSNGIIQSFNDAAEKIYGYTSGEVVGQNVNILMPEPFSTEHDDYIQNFIRTGTKKIIGKRREVIARGKDGQLFPMELGVNAVQVNGEYYFVGVTQDISQRKAAENDLRNAKEAAEKANSYKSEFLANMSHELHTPLLNIMGIVASLQKQIADKNQKQNLNLILLNTKRLLTFIDDLLDLSKLDIGKMDFIFTKNRLIYTLEDAEKEVQKQLRQKNMKLLYNKKLADKELVFDKHRMEQVFLNLLSNAIKFTPKESPQKTKEIYLNFSEEMTNEKKKVFRIEVADQGIGIPQNELAGIFKKFRKSTKTQTETEGTGLGLAICSEIIAAHHGRIWAENNKWGGTSFFIELPLDESLIETSD
jgi:PAS domain S-box-containing protein